MLTVSHLNISFGNDVTSKVVDDVSFAIGEGKTLAIVGESGSGKSLTALSLMGLLPKTAKVTGEILLSAAGQSYTLDKNLSSDVWQKVRGDHIGMIFQEPMSALNPVMKVGEQIAESMVLHQGVSKRTAKQQTIDWLDKVKIRDAKAAFEKYPHELSGGQKQRVMIAMAMCNDPVLLIADEPTTALDVTVQQEIVDLMQALQREQGTSMIFITHDLALAAKTADDVLVMYRGKPVEQGSVEDVLKNPQQDYTKALLACRPTSDNKRKRLPIVADFLEGNAIPVQKQHKTTITDDVMLKVDGLKVWFTVKNDWLGRPVEYFKAVQGVSFDLHKGEVLGLVGESGCGKSTIGRSIMGLLPIQEGQVLFNGEDLAQLPQKDWQRVRRQVQLIFQDPYGSLNPRMSIGDMLMEPLAVHNIVPKRERKNEAQRLLDLVHLPQDSLKRYPHQFSGGQRQRLGIARALAVRPQLLICDESVSALDVSVQAQILNLLKELQAEFNLSYLFISHDLNVVHYISDRVMVMQNGRFVEQGDAEQVLRHPQNEYTKKLVSAIP
ncbi:MAG: ABC transporter ATP-binding protein [Chitinophagales bacterium]|nr:ABC transporter ATP-binding protein [Chitinophagales bacterium]